MTSLRLVGEDGSVARFLSREWLDELEAAAAASDEFRRALANVDLTLQHEVLGAPDGDVRYHLRVRGGRLDAGLGAAIDPDVVLTEDYATAVALGRGELAASEAFATGRLRAGGRVALLVRYQEVFAGLGRVFASVRATTSY